MCVPKNITAQSEYTYVTKSFKVNFHSDFNSSFHSSFHNLSMIFLSECFRNNIIAIVDMLRRFY